jgi:hypothetical protein
VDGTAAQCPVPSNVQVAYATGTVCDGTGKASAASANGCCSDVIPAVDDVSIAFSGANYQGPLTPCDELDPLAGADFKVQVQKSEVGPYSGTLTQTVVDAARTDPAPSCGVRMIVTSYQEHLEVAPGAVFIIHQKTVPYDSRTRDVSRTTTLLSDAAGAPLLMVSVSATPPTVDDSLSPQIGLRVDSTPICSFAPPFGARMRAHVTDGLGDCTVDAGTQRCCSLFGGMMEVQVPAATFDSSDDPAVLVNVTLRRSGLFVLGP